MHYSHVLVEVLLLLECIAAFRALIIVLMSQWIEYSFADFPISFRILLFVWVGIQIRPISAIVIRIVPLINMSCILLACIFNLATSTISVELMQGWPVSQLWENIILIPLISGIGSIEMLNPGIGSIDGARARIEHAILMSMLRWPFKLQRWRVRSTTGVARIIGLICRGVGLYWRHRWRMLWFCILVAGLLFVVYHGCCGVFCLGGA